MSQLLSPMALKQQLSQTVALEERLNSLDASVQASVSTINRQLGDLEARPTTDSQLLERVTAVEASLQGLVAKHDAFVQSIADLDARRQSDAERSDAVAGRVDALEKDRDAVAKRVDALETTAVAKRVAELEITSSKKNDGESAGKSLNRKNSNRS